MNSTEKYLLEHKKIFSLERRVVPSIMPRKVVGWSIRRIIKYHIKSLLHASIFYPRELYIARQYLKKIWFLRNSACKIRALVIGNGPSQGYLTAKQLDNFKYNGGETFCINYWPQNIALSQHIPSWMIFSDPATFNLESSNAQLLVKYIKKNPLIKLLVPVFMLETVKGFDLRNDIYCFIDTELSIWKNISPIFPRGYVSMTLFKALAWALHLGFEEIGIIGMDNTYPRNIYNDKDNRVCNLETHAGVDDYLSDQSYYYYNVASSLDEMVRLFDSLECFPNKNIKNLDIYSLTDRFKKTKVNDFFNDENLT